MLDLEVLMKELLELAERATDDKPSFTVSVTEFGYEASVCGGSSVAGHTLTETLRKLFLRVSEELVLRVQGDAEVLAKTDRLRVRVVADMNAHNDSRQLSLLGDHVVSRSRA